MSKVIESIVVNVLMCRRFPRPFWIGVAIGTLVSCGFVQWVNS